MITGTLTISDIYEEYRTLRDSEVTIGAEAQGRAAAYSTVCSDCLELTLMVEYHRASRQAQRKYLQRAIDCYEGAWPLDDLYSVAARTAIREAAQKLQQVKL